jgi:Kef-type K+ transport system membrane component KefB
VAPSGLAVNDALRSRARGYAAYGAFVLLPLIGMLLVLHSSAARGAGTAAIGESGSPAHASLPELPLLLAQIGAVLAACWGVGRVVHVLGQPRVVGQMLAGLLLGPSILGAALPGVNRALFQPESLGYLSALAQVGLVMFMFLVGLDVDPAALRHRARAVLVISHAGIAVPLLLGVLLASTLFPALAPRGISFTAFGLFVGAALSVTAFPVLASILQERSLTQTEVGRIAIACAAVADITAWCMLAGVIVVVRVGGDSAGRALSITLGGGVVYVAAMLTGGRAAMRHLAARFTGADRALISPDLLALLVVGVFASAWITEVIGLHALFGAFAVGVVAPKDGPFVRAMRARFEEAMAVVLLPLFFAFTGLRTHLDFLASSAMAGTTLVVVAVAVAGKLGGSALAARASGIPAREALALGALMNTRGLMELVILNIGLDVGVISPTVYSMLVVMAFVTTVMTTPLIDRLIPAARRA